MFDLNRVETLATELLRQGDYETAELLFTNILEIKQRSKDADANELIAILHQLAIIAEHQNNHADALRYAKQAFKLVRDHLGPDAKDALQWIKSLTCTAA